jgi:hypothetical protein
VSAIQNNNPGALPDNSILTYTPIPYITGQVSLTQVASFIDNAIRNYNMVNIFANLITNNTYSLWAPNVVGDFLSSLYISQTSIAQLLAYAGATQMSQALSYLSGNYTNVATAFSLLVAPSTGANVLNNPNMSATQAASIINNALINIAPSYLTGVAQLLSLVSSSVLANVNAYPNVSATTLNQLINNAAMAATAAQAILYGLANNYYYNNWVYTVTANAGSTTISTNVTVVNPLYSQNLTVASGATVTCGTTTCFFVAQSFNNYGTVVAYGGAGGVPLDSAGAGGTGGGGIVVVAVTAVLGTLNVKGYPGGNAAGYAASGTGGGGSAGIFYVTSGVTVPLGGTGGNATNGYIGAAGLNGGGGGGSDQNYYGAPGGNAAVYLLSSPNDMVAYILQGLSDWWLTATVGRPPTYVTLLAYMYGSGGGAGAVTNGYQSGGGGGGGAGEVVVYGYDIVSGTVNAAGGNGGEGSYSCSTCGAGGGGGGGGGLVYIFYGATSGSVTANVAGGTGGPGLGGGSNGATGSTGVLYIAAVTVNG